MNREGHEDVKFFFGKEVEHTPAYGMDTLFVVGVQPVEDIKDALARSTYETNHVYFGANQSFPNPAVNDFSSWNSWEDMIGPFLKEGWLCTLDLDVACVEGLAESTLVEHNNFIPMISVKLPYMKLLGYNATIKLDDKDFAATNPGVWCHNLHDLQNRDRYTAWSRYTKDKVIA
jgi:hypothetical protein